MLKRIGAEESGEFKAIASGTVSSGKPVIVNSDGTVSLPVSVTGGNGTPNTFSGGNSANHNGMSEVGNSKFVIAYRDSGNSHHGTAVVATGSGTTLSYGTPVVFDSQDCREHVVVYDSNADRVVIFYYGTGDDKSYAIVGTVSGTSISFGTRVEFEPNEMGDGSGVFDPVNNKVVFLYKDVGANANLGTYIIGTVSGSSVSFTTPAVWHNAITRQVSAVYDTTNNKIVVAYRDGSASSHGKMFVADPGASSLTFGSEQTFASAVSYPHELVDDTVNGKLILFYGNASQAGSARVITVDGANKTISAGSELVYEAGSTDTTGTAAYNPLAGKAQSMCKDQGDSNKGKLYQFTVSGTSISLDSTTVIDTNGTERFVADFSPSLEASVFAYTDEDSGGQGEAFVTKLAYDTLTSENYIGMSRGPITVNSRVQAVGSAVVFESGNAPQSSIVYDSTNNKVVIAFRDVNNSNYATAIVGTVSGTSISFGTPTVYSSSTTAENRMAFDSDSGKVVIAYYDGGNTNFGTAVVGTVSGASISFGTPVVYNSGNATVNNAITFDSNSNKVVIAYKDQAQSDHGKAIVGTVSGTSISFGTEVTFNSAQTDQLSATFDSSNNKVVIVFQDTGGNSGYGSAIVGTVSGTSISFGSKVAYNAANSPNNAVTFDTTNNKVVAFYEHHGTGLYGIVGTVSGTSISFGTAVQFTSSTDGQWSENSATFDSSAGKVALAYQDTTNSKGRLIAATVSGTSLTFDDPIDLFNNASQFTSAAYDSSNEKVVVSVRDTTPNGQAIVVSLGFTNITRAEVADGGNASMDIIGSVSTNQNSLTAGQQYFVQTDGTIGTTADDPSVLAGTAISATELLVKE
jgi:hypothetical protein